MRIAILSLLLFPLSLAAQQQPVPLVETIEVRVMNVEAIVTDRKGNPVRGLTADDFEHQLPRARRGGSGRSSVRGRCHHTRSAADPEIHLLHRRRLAHPCPPQGSTGRDAALSSDSHAPRRRSDDRPVA
jgi:hypothetical protein